MTDTQHAPILSSSPTQHPPCAKCGLAMMFACIELVDDEFIERTFECHCGYTLTVRLPVSAQNG
jgi:hypothetical protein